MFSLAWELDWQLGSVVTRPDSIAHRRVNRTKVLRAIDRAPVPRPHFNGQFLFHPCDPYKMSGAPYSVHPRSYRNTTLSEERRLTRTIYDAFVSVVDSGQEEVRPGHVVQYMRDQDNPLGIWNVVGEFNKLRDMGVIALDESSATWRIVRSVSYEDALANCNGNAVKSID